MKKNDFKFLSAGHFISRGRGSHPVRIIDTYELICVLSGTLEIFEGENNYSVSAGERLFLFPGLLHGGLAAYAPALSFIWIHFQPTGNIGREQLAALPRHARIDDPEAAFAFAQTILNEQSRGLLKKEKEISLNLDDLLGILLREVSRKNLEGNAVTHIPRLAEEADKFIKLHFEESITTADVAQYLQCNPDYLGRLYMHARNMTLGEAIRRTRIHHALKLLNSTTRPVKQIAFDCGFNDPAYFRRQFVRECGITPGQYRSQQSREHVNTE